MGQFHESDGRDMLNLYDIPLYGGLATLLEGAGLALDIQKCSNFPQSIMVVLKL